MHDRGPGGMGLAVIGCGTIGSIRARVARKSPLVSHLIVCDRVPERAEQAASDCAADDQSVDYEDVVRRPDVDAVIVSTDESEHYGPVLAALEAGKHVLVEKPFVLALDEADALIRSADDNKVTLSVGYTQRYRRRYVTAKDRVAQGMFGRITSIAGRICVTRAVGESVIQRAPQTTPSVNTLTYVADLLLWMLEGHAVTSLSAVGGRGYFWDNYGVPDSEWAVIQFDSGTVASLGVSWEPLDAHPASVASMSFDIFGETATLNVTDHHADSLFVTANRQPSPYRGGGSEVSFLGTAMPGDWALGELFGPMKVETDAFITSCSLGIRDAVLADAKHSRAVLALTLAIDESAFQSPLEVRVSPFIGARPQVASRKGRTGAGYDARGK